MYKALISFSGVVSMSVGEIKEIADVNIAKDLLRAGYIVEVKPADKGESDKGETTKETKRRRTKRG